MRKLLLPLALVLLSLVTTLAWGGNESNASYENHEGYLHPEAGEGHHVPQGTAGCEGETGHVKHCGKHKKEGLACDCGHHGRGHDHHDEGDEYGHHRQQGGDDGALEDLFD